MSVIRACLTMLPRLEAEEAIDQAARVFAGSPHMTKEAGRASSRLIKDWDRLARPPAPRPAGPLKPFVIMSPGAMEAFGVRRVPVKREADGG